MIVENATKVIKHDQQCTQPLLSKKEGAYSRGGAYFKIWLIKGTLIRRGPGGAYWGGANSRIYGISFSH